MEMSLLFALLQSPIEMINQFIRTNLLEIFLSANLISECSILFEFKHKLEAQLMELHSNAQRFEFLTLGPILQTLMLLKTENRQNILSF